MRFDRSSDPIVIAAGVRTPMAEYNGRLAGFSQNELGALAARALFDQTGIDPALIDATIFGNALQTSSDAPYGARHVALKSGVPIERPALTVNRLCGSGFEAIVQGAMLLELGEAGVTLCGGMESMSQAPHVVRGARKGFRMGNVEFEDLLLATLLDRQCGLYMAQTSDNVAKKYGITREDQDAFALESQRRAAAAWDAGFFDGEVAPVEIAGKKGSETFRKDDHPTPDTTLEALAKLRPAFGKDAMVTAGNASGIVDGAAATLVMRESKAKGIGLEPLGRLVASDVVGVLPEIMGMGPAPAIRSLLGGIGWKLEEVDLFEVNEAFAGQVLGVVRELGLDRERLNVHGGAIALGHPLGASGTRLAITLCRALRLRGGKRGVASACIGGGQGIAIAVEV
jgi:acetyl-CoA acetyltransferase family protein